MLSEFPGACPYFISLFSIMDNKSKKMPDLLCYRVELEAFEITRIDIRAKNRSEAWRIAKSLEAAGQISWGPPWIPISLKPMAEDDVTFCPIDWPKRSEDGSIELNKV